MTSYQSELQDVTNSLIFLGKEYDTIKAAHDSLIAETNALKAANRELKDSNITLIKQVAQPLEPRRDTWCAKAKGESPPRLIADIGSEVKCPITPSDIDVVHKVPNTIIARFVSRDKRNDFQIKEKKACLTSMTLAWVLYGLNYF